MRSIVKKIPAKKGGRLKKKSPMVETISFSFLFFDVEDEDICPSEFEAFYTRELMLRLQILSKWTYQDFVKFCEKNIRNHRIDWNDTSRPAGFARLSIEHRATQAWQFAVHEHTYGRVHGFFIGSIFQVVWLDRDHILYPMKPKA